MADIQLKDLTAVTSITSTDIVGLQRSIVGTYRDRKITAGEIFQTPNVINGTNITGVDAANVIGTLSSAQLEGGSASPGNSKYFGTNSGGTKGFFDLPAGSGSGNGNPAGSNTYVQFNDTGTFGGDAGLTYNKTTDTLSGVNFYGKYYGDGSPLTGITGLATVGSLAAHEADTTNIHGITDTADLLTSTNSKTVTNKIIDASQLTGTVAPARLGTGSGGSTKFLREDSTFQTIGGGGDALTANGLNQFASTTSALLRGVISDETGTGVLVFGSGPTIDSPTLTGPVRRAGTQITPSNILGGLIIDVTQSRNQKSIGADSSFTFSATPTSGSWFSLFVYETGSATRAITIPASFSMNRGTIISGFNLGPNAKSLLTWFADGSSYELYGDPVTINDLVADSTPDSATDYIETWDASASAHKKVLLSNLPTVSGAASFLSSVAGSAALSSAGQLSLNTTDKQIGINNGTREVAIPLTQHMAWTFDPKAVCDGTVDRLFLMTVGPDAPKGIKLIRWNFSFEADPTTEVDLDLKRADAFIGVANSAVMDILDTTAGVSNETTAANINADAVVANGKIIYLEFGTAYTEASHQCILELWWEVEED